MLSGKASALAVISPTEGSAVRERVKIVIPRSAVPADGFVSISIDGKFRAAAAMPEEIKNPKNASTAKSPYYTYIWDTKAPVLDSKSGTDQVILGDGKHEVEVMVHDHNAKALESSKVNIRLANKVARPINAPPIKLYYKYHLGEQTVYRCKVDGEILDNLGQPLLSGVSAIKAEFDVIQTIEDIRSNGNALVRYKIGKDALIQLYGKTMAVPEASLDYPSIYKEIDKYGRVVQANIIRKTNTKITDVMPRFPGRSVQVGDSWPSEFRIKLEGIGGLVPLQMTNVLDSIEWESGRECAKIKSSFTSTGKINIIPGDKSDDQQAPAKGTALFYFAYNSGKLLKATATMEADMSIDPGALNSLQQSTSSGGEAAANPYDPNTSEVFSDSEGYEDSGRRQRVRKPAATAQVYGPGGMINQQAEKTTVKVKLNWSLDFKK
jgi:hypothetical protein